MSTAFAKQYSIPQTTRFQP